MGAEGAPAERSEEIEFLFDELSIEEKRAALHQLGGRQHKQSTKTSDEVEDAILGSGRSLSEIISVLRRLHASVPKKHCFFGTVRGDARKAVDSIKKTRRAGNKDDIALTFTAVDGDVAYITFERSVSSYEWITLPARAGFDEVRGKRVVTARHATVVRVEIATARAMLTYRGLPIGSDYDYPAAISAVLKALAARGLDFEPLPVRGCITSLITAKGRRVLPVRGDLLTPEGEIKLRSRTGKSSIEQLVARLLSDGETSETELLDKITANLGKHTFEVIGLLWAEEKVLTRVAFATAGADFLFVWGHTSASFATIERMIALLYELAARLVSPDFNTIWSAISELSTAAILRPHEFRNRFSRPAEETDLVILEAVKAGLLEPVFMLNCAQDDLEEMGETEWTPDLPRLRREFVTSRGLTVDGSDPKNIHVAFRRIRIGKLSG